MHQNEALALLYTIPSEVMLQCYHSNRYLQHSVCPLKISYGEFNYSGGKSPKSSLLPSTQFAKFGTVSFYM